MANCLKCGSEFKPTLMKDFYGVSHWLSWVVEHIKPLARGGANDLSNMLPAHKICNATKAARELDSIVSAIASTRVVSMLLSGSVISPRENVYRDRSIYG